MWNRIFYGIGLTLTALTASGLTALPGEAALLVSSFGTGSVLEYDEMTGEFTRIFASGGGLTNPTGLIFGSNGNLFVNSFGTSSVLEYDEKTGEFIRTFVSSGSGGLGGPGGLVFKPDGNLLVSSESGNVGILEYDGTTGEFIKTFASGGGLTNPTDLIFSPTPIPESSSGLGTIAFAVLGARCVMKRKLQQ